MLRQVCRDYSGLGNFRDLTVSEIAFFYDGLRPELRQATTPRHDQSVKLPKKFGSRVSKRG